MPTDNSDLAALRMRIDDIDSSIITLLSQRFQATSKVGLIKAQLDFSPVDPEREAMQRARYADLAVKHNLNEDLVQKIFRTVIDEVVKNHKAITNSAPE